MTDGSGSGVELADSREQNVVLLVDVLVEVQLEGGERIKQGAVRATQCRVWLVLPAQHAQRGKSVANARVLALVLV